MNKIFIEKVDNFDKKCYEKTYCLLNNIYKRKIDKKKDKNISLLGYKLLDDYIKKNNINCSLNDLKLNCNGKPYFDNNICFSISNKDNISVLVISNTDVGVDIEKIKGYDINIINNFFTDVEKKILSNNKENINNIFYEIVTLKESYIKMIGSTINDFNLDEYKNNNIKSIFYDKEYIISICEKKNSC